MCNLQSMFNRMLLKVFATDSFYLCDMQLSGLEEELHHFFTHEASFKQNTPGLSLAMVKSIFADVNSDDKYNVRKFVELAIKQKRGKVNQAIKTEFRCRFYSTVTVTAMDVDDDILHYDMEVEVSEGHGREEGGEGTANRPVSGDTEGGENHGSPPSER
jgi:hypothetical protein